MYLRSFSIKGYRSFCDTVTLDDLGPAVVFFGNNNAGKTNLIRAIDLFHRLMKLELARLLDTASRNADAFYSELGQDAWMFHIPGRDIVELEGGIAFAPEKTPMTIGFRIARDGDGISLELSDWNGACAGTPLARARDARSAMIKSQDLPAPSKDAPDEEKKSWQEAIALADSQWKQASDEWARMVEGYAPGMSIHLAVQDGLQARALRKRFIQLTKSVDLKRRKRAVWAIERFAAVVPGLAEGRLEPIESPTPDAIEPADTSDFGWVSNESILPLDQLGSGARSTFAVLAALALADTRVVALEEPESSLNAKIQRLLADTIVGSVGAEVPVSQLFVATHSPAFAHCDCDIRLVDRLDGDTMITREPASVIRDLTGFPPPPGDDHRDRTASLLDYDGTIRLPEHVLNEFEVSKGHFVYFVRAEGRGFRIVASSEMREMLGDDEP